ncbi:MAG: hypothetical protein ACLUOI_26375 [Eisenbergiella sp.]
MKENYPDITPYAFAGKITDGNYTNFLLSYVSRENVENISMSLPYNRFEAGHKDGLRQLNQFVLDGIIPADFAVDVDSTSINRILPTVRLICIRRRLRLHQCICYRRGSGLPYG